MCPRVGYKLGVFVERPCAKGEAPGVGAGDLNDIEPIVGDSVACDVEIVDAEVLILVDDTLCNPYKLRWYGGQLLSPLLIGANTILS